MWYLKLSLVISNFQHINSSWHLEHQLNFSTSFSSTANALYQTFLMVHEAEKVCAFSYHDSRLFFISITERWKQHSDS